MMDSQEGNSSSSDVFETANELLKLYLPSQLFMGNDVTSMAGGEGGGGGRGSGDSGNGGQTVFQGPRGGFLILDLTTSVLALMSNCIIMVAVFRMKLSLGGYRRFLLSLAAADILMASTTILTFLHQYVSERYRSLAMVEKCGNNLLRSLTLVGYFSSLLTIGGLTADNFLGIFKPLRYNQFMSGRRTQCAIVFLWILSLFLGFIDMPVTAVSFLNNRFRNDAGGSPSPSSAPVVRQSMFNDDYMASPETTPIMTTTTTKITTTTTRPTTAKAVVLLAAVTPMLTSRRPSKLRNTTTRGAKTTAWPVVVTSTTTEEPNNSAGDFKLDQIIHDILQFVEEEQETDDWCSFYSSKKFGVEYFVIGLTVPCFILLLVIYGRIFYEVMSRRDSAERNTKRLVLTTLLLIGSFTFCWIPFITFELSMLLRTKISPGNHPSDASAGAYGGVGAGGGGGAAGDGSSSGVGNSNENTQTTMLIINCFFNSLLMLSPLLNPIIYAVRLQKVRLQLLNIISCGKARLSMSEDGMSMNTRASVGAQNEACYRNRAQSAIVRSPGSEMSALGPPGGVSARRSIAYVPNGTAPYRNGNANNHSPTNGKLHSNHDDGANDRLLGNGGASALDEKVIIEEEPLSDHDDSHDPTATTTIDKTS